jgi:Zn-dependent protease
MYVRPSRRILGAEFGREELRHIAFAAGALTVVFAAAFARTSTALSPDAFPAAFAYFLPLAGAAAAPAFFLALVIQKRVAAREGCTTEFRLLPQMLLISVLFAFLLGFAFAAPGATARFGNVTRTGAGKMSAAVPLSYAALGGAAIIAVVGLGGVLPVLAGAFLLALARISALLAVFAMIPVPGFAGADIWRWSKPFFAVTLAVAAGLYFASSLR